MSDRIDRYCLTCGNVTVADAGYYAGSSFYRCETCGQLGMGEKFPKATVFRQITASPEVLAPHLVYGDKEGYFYSTIIEGERFLTIVKAIAATVAKLKEVER